MNHVTNDIVYVGVNDHKIDLFESQYSVPCGMAYNSYVILDEKIAVMDTAESHFVEEWLSNLKEALGDKKPSYLIVQHMEPDHSAGIMRFAEEYPEATVVGNAKTFAMMGQFFNRLPAHTLTVKEGETLNLGKHILTFVFAPMVHWPEVMVTYDATDKVLFSADGFGKFGALDTDEAWTDEARRYYIGIVGKYGVQVQSLLKKASALDIAAICPLHGPVLKDRLPFYINLYHTWSSYLPEKKGVLIAYTSVYGHTKAAAEELANMLRQKGADVVLTDLARGDMSKAVAEAFCYDRIVLATTTYNASVFPPMNAFLTHLAERNFQNRTVGIIENGTWAPAAAKVIKERLAAAKNLNFLEPVVTIKSALTEQNREQLQALAEALVAQD